ncbi:MAG: hypothetical protein ACLQUT_05285 [Thermoleophilia bacterium]
MRIISTEAILLVLGLVFLVAGTVCAVAYFHWSILAIAVALIVWGFAFLFAVWSESWV